MGLLDDLKKQADAVKAQDVDKTESLRSNAVAVDHALRRAFLYMNDLGKQLNVVKMPSPFVYKLPTVGDIAGLSFRDFFVDFCTKNFIDKDYYNEFHVAARCASEQVLSVKKGPDDMEKFRDILWQFNIEHKSGQYRDQRKVITHEIFQVTCDFRIQAKFEGNDETGPEPAAHFMRALRSFSEAGLVDAKAQTFVSELQAPLNAEQRVALTSLIEMLWNVPAEAPEADRAVYQRLCRASSPDFILYLPEYYGFFTYTLFTGTVTK